MKQTHIFRRYQKRPRTGDPLLINFMLGEDLYAIDMRWISRVELNINLHPIPCVPRFVVGITLLANQVITVVDLHEFLEVRGVQVEPKAQIVLDVRGQLISFLSDSVPGFISLENPIQPISDEEVSILIGVSRLGNTSVKLLDAESLFFLLTGNIQKMRNRALLRVSDRVTELLGDVAIFPEGVEAPDCLHCDNLGFLIVNLEHLFATTLSALKEMSQDPGAKNISSFNTAALTEIVEASLESADPFTDLREHLEGELGEVAFEILIALLEENHVNACPYCKDNGDPE
jgi:purine-binding chemotaxis protein CheW